MAKTKIKCLKYPKPKTCLHICCFGSLHHKTPRDHSSNTPPQGNLKQKSQSSSWFPWQRIRQRILKNSVTKTVPLEGSESDETEKLKLDFILDKANKVQSSSGWKSKSNLLNKLLHPVTPNQTPSNSKQNGDDYTRQQNRSTPTTRAMSRAGTFPTSKRHLTHYSKTTSQHHKQKQLQNAKKYGLVVAASVVMVTLVSTILWGRLCSIFCTSAWFYLIPRLRITVENDEQNHVNDSNKVVFDSKVCKKKVIQERLLQRNHTMCNKKYSSHL